MTSVPLSPSQKRGLESATRAYQSQLDEPALAYLERRGLAPVTETLRFGVVRSPVTPEHDRFRGMLAIPYLNPRGEVTRLKMRCIEDHVCKEHGHTKYDGPSGPIRIYNTAALVAPTDYLFVTEGELDAATLTACNWPAIGLPGAQTLPRHFARVVAGFPRVTLLADNDDAGRKLADSFRSALPSSGRVIVMSSDVNDEYTKGGKAALVELMKERDQ